MRKSTVFKSDLRFDNVFSAYHRTVKVRGKPIDGPGIDRGMVFQKYSIFPHLTVLQNVKFGLEVNRDLLGIDQKQIDKSAREWVEKLV
jgi:NitT/TauT family transport system ATP-binding protein